MTGRLYAARFDPVPGDGEPAPRASPARRATPRAADPEDLQREFAERSGKMNQVAASLPEALDLASRAVGRDDLICITGSFYLVGEAKKYLAELEKKRG